MPTFDSNYLVILKNGLLCELYPYSTMVPPQNIQQGTQGSATVPAHALLPWHPAGLCHHREQTEDDSQAAAG